jgi:hypothetical protein
VATSLIQRSFASGEITPSIYPRVDTTKYSAGLRSLKNQYVMRHGGTVTRAGTKHNQEVKDSEKRVRLIEFIFSLDQAYALEFGDKYIRIIKNDSYIYEDDLNITGITIAAVGVFTSAGHGLTVGEEVFIEGVLGMTEVNGRSYRVLGTPTANTFTLETLDGTALNTSTFTAYTSGGTVAAVYEVVSPYVEPDLQQIHYVQSADVITLTHKYYPPYELARIDEAQWTLTQISFTPDISTPAGLALSTAAGTTSYYTVTAIASETFEESLPATKVGTSTTPSSGTPVTVSWTAVTGATEYNVYREINGVMGLIGIAGSNSFVDIGYDIDPLDTPPEDRDPFELETAKVITGVTQAATGVVTSTAHGFLTGDLIYIDAIVGMTELNAEYYFVVRINANTFSLEDRYGVTVDTSAFTAYTSGGTAQKAHNFPVSVTYYQQRRCFMQTINKPETFWASRTGLFTNFTTSSPIQDDDSITFTLAGRKVNKIKSAVDIGTLIILTESGPWNIKGNDAGTLVPSAINPVQTSFVGAADTMPITANRSIIHVQSRGSVVHDLIDVQGEKDGSEISIYNAHLVDGFELVDMAYQQIPHSIAWFVRDDGVLLSLTYVKEQQIAGWARHDFDGGLVENVCCIPVGNEDAIYLVIKRTIDGRTTRYIERMTTRFIDDIRDNIFMDSALTYDGRNTSAKTMTLSGGTTWLTSETLTLTASSATFKASDVGNHVFLYDASGFLLRFNILAFTSSTVVTGKPLATVPVTLRNTATAIWSLAVDQISGLWHLEGEELSITGDGMVIGSPYNEAYNTYTVANGSVTLDRPYAVIHAGLPFIWETETLDLDTANNETMSDKKKFVSRVTVHLEKSRGGFFGIKPPADDSVDPLQNLTEMKIRDDEGYEDPVGLRTGTASVLMQANWNNNGRIFIRGVDPSPVSILAIVPEGMMPTRGQ